MKNTTQQLLKGKWTGPIDKSGKLSIYEIEEIAMIMQDCEQWKLWHVDAK